MRVMVLLIIYIYIQYISLVPIDYLVVGHQELLRLCHFPSDYIGRYINLKQHKFVSCKQSL